MSEDENVGNQNNDEDNLQDDNNNQQIVEEMEGLVDEKNPQDLEKIDVKTDLKNYLLNFGDGNLNLFKEFSQSSFRTNFKIKQENKSKKGVLIREENKPLIKVEDNSNLSFVFNIENIPEKNEIFSLKKSRKSSEKSNIFLGKKRKLLKLNHLETTL